MCITSHDKIRVPTDFFPPRCDKVLFKQNLTFLSSQKNKKHHQQQRRCEKNIVTRFKRRDCLQRGTNTIWKAKKYCYSKYNKKDIFQNYKCKRKLRRAYVCDETNTVAQLRTLPFEGIRWYISKYYLFVSYIIHKPECAFVHTERVEIPWNHLRYPAVSNEPSNTSSTEARANHEKFHAHW